MAKGLHTRTHAHTHVAHVPGSGSLHGHHKEEVALHDIGQYFVQPEESEQFLTQSLSLLVPSLP